MEDQDEDHVHLNAQPGWMQELPEHPIFQLSPEELEQWTKSAKRSSLRPLQREPFNGSSSVTDVTKQLSQIDVSDTAYGRRSNMVLRDADVFVAIGSTIRVASLADAKRRKVDGLDNLGKYQTLKVSLIDFEIRSLEVNPVGKLMAVVGSDEVTVVVLPRPGYYKLFEEAIPCKGYHVGKFYHYKGASTSIAKVSWHPLAEGGTGLLVLTTDGTLRLYDVARDVNEPEQEYEIGNVSHRGVREASFGYSADFDDQAEAASFCLGTADVDWGPLTAYVVMQNGTIYSVCPVLPRSAIVNRSYIRILATIIAKKCDELAVIAEQDKDAFSHMLDQYRMQSKWITPLVRQAAEPPRRSPADEESEIADDLVKIDATSSVRFPPLIQGPYLMKPAPAEFGDDEPLATDIIYLSTDPLPIIAIAYNNGKIDVCVEVEKTEARWASRGTIDAAKKDLPSLLVYESINLGLMEVATKNKTTTVSQGDNHPVLVADTVYPDTFYCYHRYGVHAINNRRWLNELEDCERPEELDQLKSIRGFSRSKKTAELTCILNAEPLGSSPSPPITAVSVVNDIYLSYSLMIMSSALQLVPIELSLRVDIMAKRSDRMSVDPGYIDMNAVNDNPHYISMLQTPAFTPPDTLANFQPRGRVLLPPDKKGAIKFDDETLRLLGNTVQEFRNDLRTLAKANNATQQRFQLQIQELPRQLSKLQDAVELSNTIRERHEKELESKKERLSKRQEELLARADRILQSLIDAHEPTLSHAEEAWFKEIQKLQRYVQSDTGLDKRVKTARHQLDILGEDFPQLVRSNEQNTYGDTEGMGLSQIGQIQVMLENEAELLETATAKIQALALNVERAAT